MKLHFCDLCSRQVKESDLEVQHAFWFGHVIYCRQCVTDRGLTPPQQPTRNAGSSSGLMSLGSGIRKGPAGSGVRASPGSGVRASAGSGIRPSPSGSGVRATRHSPASGVRVGPTGSGVRRTSSGLHGSVPESRVRPAPNSSSSQKLKAARSGLHNSPTGSAIRAAKGEEPPGHSRRRIRKRGERGAGNMAVLTLTAGILVLLVGVSLFFLLRR